MDWCIHIYMIRILNIIKIAFYILDSEKKKVDLDNWLTI